MKILKSIPVMIGCTIQRSKETNALPLPTQGLQCSDKSERLHWNADVCANKIVRYCTYAVVVRLGDCFLKVVIASILAMLNDHANVSSFVKIHSWMKRAHFKTEADHTLL